MKVPLYPEIIYNNRQPLISVTYEYGEIELILPLAYEILLKNQKKYIFLVFGQGDTSKSNYINTSGSNQHI